MVTESGDAQDELDLSRKVKRSFLIAGLVAVVLVGVYAVWFGAVNRLPLSAYDALPWGTFGDFLGGVLNPLIAGIALYWLTQATKIQRKELTETRKELAEASRIQADQLALLSYQRFDAIFFSLFAQCNVILNTWATGRDRQSRAMLSDAFGSNQRTLEGARSRVELYELENSGCHYFRLLHETLRLVAVACPSSTAAGDVTPGRLAQSRASREEQHYADIVVATLSPEVLQLLSAFAYTKSGSDAWRVLFKELLERYAVLRRLPNSGNVSLLAEIRAYYGAGAFEPRRSI